MRQVEGGEIPLRCDDDASGRNEKLMDGSRRRDLWTLPGFVFFSSTDARLCDDEELGIELRRQEGPRRKQYERNGVMDGRGEMDGGGGRCVAWQYTAADEPDDGCPDDEIHRD